MTKTIRIPGRGPIQLYSDTEMFITVPGDGPIDVDEIGVPDGAWVDGAGGYWVDGSGGYWIT